MADLFLNLRQQLFDRWASTYDCLIPSVFYQAIHQRLLEYVHLPDHSHVLDIGCGTGRLLNRLAMQYPMLQGTGIDFSSEMIHQAKQHNRHSSRLTYCQGNAESLPLADQQFDAVFNTISFLHYSSPEAVLAEVQRVLLPGGYFYLVDFSVRWATEAQVFGLTPNSCIWLYSPMVRETMGQAARLATVAHYYLLGSVLLTVFTKPC